MTALFSSKQEEKKKSSSVSAAQQERRNADVRRKERKADVVLGKTSAIPGEEDFPLDVQATEESWMKQASNVEQEIFQQTQRGLNMIKMLRLDDAKLAFDRVFALKPDAYVWQAGIVLYYLNQLRPAAEIFHASAIRSEQRFGMPASEERLWRDACELKEQSLTKNLGEGFPKLEREEGSGEDLPETRKVFRVARDLFESSTSGNLVGVVLGRARLQSICGDRGSHQGLDRKMWKLSAWYYLGLHYDAMGEEEHSKACMKMALRLCPSAGHADDLIQTLPLLHMTVRDWFDDEDFDPVLLEEPPAMALIEVGVGLQADPIVVESIQTSISKLNIRQIRAALKTQGLVQTGPKDEVQKRLFLSLIEEIGQE